MLMCQDDNFEVKSDIFRLSGGVVFKYIKPKISKNDWFTTERRRNKNPFLSNCTEAFD